MSCSVVASAVAIPLSITGAFGSAEISGVAEASADALAEGVTTSDVADSVVAAQPLRTSALAAKIATDL
jgi:hypothetical protein